MLRLEDEDGRIGWGEIAPISFFGSESIEQALRFCQSLPAQITAEMICQIPESLPACQFGFESAWEQLEPHSQSASERMPSSILLPTGTAALDSPQLFTAQPNALSPTTFKWKIGVASVQAELATFEQLMSVLPVGAKLRLDANGGLSWQQADLWLRVCDGYGIEYLEQPLPPHKFDLMLKLSQRHSTPIALDESVTTLSQLKTCSQHWQGIFVIKAPIAGSPIQLRNFCQTHTLDIVWSSVFETSIARSYIETYLMAALPASNRATGFGVDHWFRDRWEHQSAEQLWQRLTPQT